MTTTMVLVNEHGHQVLQIPETSEGTARAQQLLDDQRARGCVAFAGDNGAGDLLRLDGPYVPGFARVYLVRPLAGG